MVVYLGIDSGCKNNAVVKLDIKDNEIKILKTDLFNFCGNKKVKQCSFDSIINNLIEQFNNYDYKDVECVLIENVPSKLNMIVKSMSIATLTLLKSKGLNVKLVSPSRKLNKEQNKLSYKERKAEGIKKCFELINKNDKIDIIEKYKSKQDDITDTIIMCYEYNKRTNIDK